MNLHLHPHLQTMSSVAATTTATTQASSCFVYGTLMSPDVLQVLLGRIPNLIPNAILPNHSRHPVIGRVYPGVIPTSTPRPSSSSASSSSSLGASSPTSSDTVKGLLIVDITPLEMKILDWFESDDYTRSTVQVVVQPSDGEGGCPTTPGEEQNSNSEQLLIETNTYLWSLGKESLDTSCDWDYSAFLRNHLGWFLEHTVEPCRRRIESEIIILPSETIPVGDGEREENCSTEEDIGNR
jgi:hypothetical protein